ncbi:ankyrin repeat domain-containing protein, partial [archaeon]
MAEEAHAVRRTDVALTASAFARAVADPESSEESIVTALRSGSASPNDVSDAGTPVLCTAARLGRIDIVRALLAAGARVDERDREENTALLTAVRYGHADAAQLLINAGAN